MMNKKMGLAWMGLAATGLLIVGIAGCGNQEMVESDTIQKCTVIYADKVTFSEANLYALLTSSGDTIFVLSRKERVGTPPPFAHFETIRVGSIGDVSLARLPEQQRLHIRGEYAPDSYYVFDKLFWSAGVVRVPVHSSPQVYSTYLALPG